MRYSLVTLILAAGPAFSAPAASAPKPAAKPIRVKVDSKGVLRVPAATVRALGVKPAPDGLVCLQFPLSILKKEPEPKGHKGHKHVEPRPPRVWAPIRPDGSVALHKTRLIPGPEVVPGGPGSTWLIRGEEGRLVLSKP